MNYSQALKKLTSQSEFSIKLGLQNIERLLAKLAHPQKQFPLIHIAGTNGKGSVASTMVSVLQFSGYKTGLYTSPHLVDFRERIQINQQLISKSDVLRGLQLIYRLIEKEQEKAKDFIPTYFEIVTALALDYFSRKKVDVAVLETGLGGRLDSTNVCMPQVSVITPIAKDHSEILGKNLRSIALEKAGIIKSQVPVIVSKQTPTALKILRLAAKQKKCRLIQSPPLKGHKKSRNLEKEVFSFKGKRWHFENLETNFVGKHQVENAVTALTALEHLSLEGYSISEESVRKGLLKRKWRGRFQIVQKEPLLILDGGHNVSGIKSLLHTLKEKNCQNPIFVFGIMNDKEITPIIRQLCQKSDCLFLVQSQASKAMKVTDLAKLFKKERFNGKLFLSGSIFKALPQALKIAQKAKRTVCVCGSLYLVGEALQFIKNHER